MTRNLPHILVFSWKDSKHPKAGGAEVFTHQVLKRLAIQGYEVTLFCPSYNGAKESEVTDGYTVKRRGNTLTTYFKAFLFYRKNKYNFDIVIDQINTLPFCTPLYVPRAKRVALIHQIAGPVWFYQLNPIIGAIGFLSERLYLNFYRKTTLITVSDSTKRDLQRIGIKGNLIHIVPEGIDVPIKQEITKKSTITKIAYFGSIRPMKRVLDIVKAFKHAHDMNPTLRLVLAGGGDKKYIKKIKTYIINNNLIEHVSMLGFVDDSKKAEFFDSVDIVVLTSILEGWGLVASEAHARGVPTVVYNVNGLRDSTKNNVTGLVTHKNTPEILGDAILKLSNDTDLYHELSIHCLNDSANLNWDNTTEEIKNVLHNYPFR